MDHPLQQKLTALRSRLWRVVLMHAVARIVAAVVGVAVVLGMVDYLVRLQDAGLRILGSLVLVAVFGWTCYWHLLRRLALKLRDVDLARRVQARFPQLGDRLASAVEFLGQSDDDPTAGSAALRRSVIARSAAEAEPIDFRGALDLRSTLRVVLGSASICLVAAILVALSPASARIAVARLVNPLGGTAWPQQTHLALRERVERVAQGQAFEVEVTDARGAELPDDVTIHYRFVSPEGGVQEESELLSYLDGMAVARREDVSRPFSYRVTGGDDRSMPWIEVEVLEPPRLESLAVRLIPPAYSGLPAETAGRLIRALVGTRVAIEARSTKPLSAAILRVQGGRAVAARLREDGRALSFGGDAEPLVVEKSATWSLDLRDAAGLSCEGVTRWEVRAVPDAPPSVTVERPATVLYVTPRATVPLRVVAKDDLAVKHVGIVVGGPGTNATPPWGFSLYDGPERASPRTDRVASGPQEGEALPPIEFLWDLASMELVPGAQVSFTAEATDYLPQAARSESRILAVVSPQELADRLAGRQSAILAELARILQMQRDSRGRVLTEEAQIAETGRFDQLDLDRLRGAELNQRQVNRSLASPSDGLPTQVLSLLADLENNKVDSPDVRRRMEEILAGIGRLEREHLPAVARDLTAAVKVGQVHLDRGEAGSLDEISRLLAGAGAHQDAVIRELESMLGELAPWESYRRFHRELTQLLREQEDLVRRSSEVARRTLTKERRDLLPQDLADLRRLARQQFDLARRLDRLQQQLGETAVRLEEVDPLAAATVADALARAQELSVGGTMRSAGSQLEANRMGYAVSQQKQVIEGLREILDILANRREQELGRLVKKLRQAESDLGDLAARQEETRKAFEAAGKQSGPARQQDLERAARRQAELEERSRRLARRLERLLADRAAKTTESAAGKMAGAGESGCEGEASSAAAQSAAARDELQAARQQLAQRRNEAEVELALKQLARLGDAVRNLHQRQQNVLDETRRLDRLRESEGGLTAGQEDSLIEAGREQALLREEVVAMGGELAGAGAFRLALEGIAGDMAAAAERLARQDTGSATRRAQQGAVDRLAQLREALKPEEPEAPDGQGGSSEGPAPAVQGARTGGVQTLAELKLLKLMQASINDRTQSLEQAFGEGAKTDGAARREYRRLSEEQGRLARLVVEMLLPQPDPEQDPDSLPAPRRKPRAGEPGPTDPLEESLR